MPWKEVTSWTSGSGLWPACSRAEKMAPLCAEFGISRKTRYKIFDRYKDCGVVAFSDRSRRALSTGESAGRHLSLQPSHFTWHRMLCHHSSPAWRMASVKRRSTPSAITPRHFRASSIETPGLTRRASPIRRCASSIWPSPAAFIALQR
jgi:hypothetical protein